MAEPLQFTEEELKAIRKEYAAGATDEQFSNFIRECRTRNLIPGRHVYFQTRTAKEYDKQAGAYVYVTRAISLTSIDAFRLIAQRTGQYKGQQPPVFIYLDNDGGPTVESKVPLPASGSTEAPRQPWAVRVGIYREGFLEPLTVTARFTAYAVTYEDKQGRTKLNSMWSKRGPEQLAKCAEALALRQAFPEDLGGLYIAEEIKDEVEEAPETPAVPTVAVAPAPAPTAVPAVNHAPAEGTDAPRPNKEEKPKRKPGRPATKPSTGPASPAPSAPSSEAAPAQTSEVAQARAAAASVSEPPVAPEVAAPVTEDAGPNPAPAGPNSPAVEDRPLTAEEKKAYGDRLRAIRDKAQVESADLKAFILKFAGVKDTPELKKSGWDGVLAKLEAESDPGELTALIKGSPSAAA